MSDFDHNAATAQYGRPLTRAEAAVVDVGLRAYMLRIYNYMVLGLAITGLAALGIYMLSVTGDASAARNANGAAAALRSGVYLTPNRLRAVRQPAEVGGDPRAARACVLLQLPYQYMRPATAQLTVLDLCGNGRRLARLDLPDLHARLGRARVLHHGGVVRRALAVGLHHAARPHRAWARS